MSRRAAQQEARSHKNRWWTLAVLCLSVLLVAIDNTIVNVALPTLVTELDATTSQLQWIVDAYSMVFAGLLLVAGNIGDRAGRRRILQVGLIVFAIASLFAAWSDSADSLIGARAVMGVAAALVYPSTLATLPQVFKDRGERAIAIGVWAGVSGLAIALGPVAGGLLLRHFWWGSIFLVNIPVIIFALVAGVLLVPESRDPRPGRFDVVGAVSSTLTIGVLVWTIIEAPVNGWGSRTSIIGFSVAGLLAVLFVVWESRHENPLLEIRFFANPRFSAGAATTAMAFFGLFGFIFMITLYFQIILGWDALKAGLATLPYALIMGGMSPVAMIFVGRLGAKLLVGGGMAISASGFLLASWAEVDSPYWTFIVPCMALMAAGMGLATGPATDAILAALPAAKSGVGSAVNDTTREIGGALGVAIVGSTMSSWYGERLVTLWSDLQVPPDLIATAKESVGAAMAISTQLPQAVSEQATIGVGDAFIEGLRIGCYVVAAACLLASLAAFAFLPAHDRPVPDEAQSGAVAEGGAPTEDAVRPVDGGRADSPGRVRGDAGPAAHRE